MVCYRRVRLGACDDDAVAMLVGLLLGLATGKVQPKSTPSVLDELDDEGTLGEVFFGCGARDSLAVWGGRSKTKARRLSEP